MGIRRMESFLEKKEPGVAWFLSYRVVFMVFALSRSGKASRLFSLVTVPGTIQVLRQHVFGFFRPTHLRQHK